MVIGINRKKKIKEIMIKDMMNFFNFDYDTSLKIYEFYDNRNEISIIVRDIEWKSNKDKERNVIYE